MEHDHDELHTAALVAKHFALSTFEHSQVQTPQSVDVEDKSFYELSLVHIGHPRTLSSRLTLNTNEGDLMPKRKRITTQISITSGRQIVPTNEPLE